MQRIQLRERLSGLRQDLRLALRHVRKAPGFTAVAALTLALGVGATTSIFSVVSQVVLRPLPYPHADRIMQVWEVTTRGNQVHLADPNFLDLEKYNHSFSSLAVYYQSGATLVSNGEGVRALATWVSPRFFDVLGARPAAGRFFLTDEQQAGAPTTVVISYGFWQRQYAGARTAVGSTITADSRAVTIIGVLPPNVEFPAGSDVFLASGNPRNTSRTAHNRHAIGRLKNGVTVEQAQQDVSGVFRRLKAQFGAYTDAIDGSVVPLQDQIAGPIKPTLYLVLGASGILLLIACANVVNLLVARMASREREMAVRVALGAGRSRLVQQMLIESSVLALAGCAGGLALALAGVRALVVLRPANIPGVERVGLDWRVLLFALCVSGVTAFALGLIAAWRGAGGDVRAALAQGRRTQGGGATDRIRGALVIIQVAMTVVLLIGAGLLGRSFVRLMRVDPGFHTHGLVVARLSSDQADGSAHGLAHGSADAIARRAQYFGSALAALRSIPGVTAAGGVSDMPLNGGGADGTFLILNSIDVKLQMSDLERLFQDKAHTGAADYRIATADYFRTMGIPLLSGRGFTDADRAGAPHVAVVSAALAKAQWPAENPVGKVIEFGNMDGDLTPMTIVGVVGDVRDGGGGLSAPPQRVLYSDYRQRGGGYARTIVLATATPAAVMNEVRRRLRRLRPDLPAQVTTIEQMVDRSLTQQRFMLLLIGVFGAVALMLASLGVYSVISYLVAQRGHELSIRVALGAGGGDIVKLVLGQGVVLALIGTIIGAVGALATTRLLRQLLYEISPTDPLAFVGVVGLLTVVAAAASYLPARRAARASPMDVLRGG